MKHWSNQEIGELTSLIKKYKVLPVSIVESFAKKYNRDRNSVTMRSTQIRKKYNLTSRYTKEEINIIKDCVKKYPYNLKLAFADAAVLINRSYKAVDQYYYSHIANKKGKNNTLFAIFSNSTLLTNKKNIAKNNKHFKNVRHHKTTTIFERIKKLFS